MRLKPELAARLLLEIRAIYGADAEVWLFGSHVDDRARGGDIDLYVEVADDTELLDRHLAVRRALYRLLGERKVDLLVRPRTRGPSPMEAIARKTSIPLHAMTSSRQIPSP
ncbi:MAG: nucleotidyltransferase domain-containing protein [Pseudomonadota bacterium]